MALLAAFDLVQGTSGLGVADVWAWLTGRGSDQADAILTSLRLPRMAAGLLVGLALGAAGAVTQTFARNVLASPDTLAVNDAAFLAVVLAAVFGWQPEVLGQYGLAFVGGLAGALLVLAMAGGSKGTIRLILAGIALSLVLAAFSTALLIVFPMESLGAYAWSEGNLSQTGWAGVSQVLPVLVVSLIALMLIGRRLDLLLLGEDTASSLGVPVRRTQLWALICSVLLAAGAVTLVGPIAFVGLVAPTLVRLAARYVPGLHRHRALVPASMLCGAVVVLGSDVAVRALLGADRAVQVPAGVMTSLLGAVVLVTMALRMRASRITHEDSSLDVRGAGTRRFGLLLGAVAVAAVMAVIAGFMTGDRVLLLGDISAWLRGEAGPIVSAVLDSRAPRVVAAFLAGVALAVAGTSIQGVTRNPLGDTTIIGVSGGASVLAVLVVTFMPWASFWTVVAAASVGAALAAGLVFGLTARSGFATDRLVLVGIGVSVAASALVTLIIVATDPWNQSKALIWLSGSTYGRSFAHLIPLAVGCLVVVPLTMTLHRRLDLLSVDDELPILLGVRLSGARLALLGCATVLTGVAVAAIGIVAFVGLVAPHAARSLVGRRHLRVIPMAALLGGILVVLADMLGRTLMAPVQLPASLLTAVVGAPYFFWLMYSARTSPPR